MTARWLRPILALLALGGVALLGGCGGGSGAPNNPFAPVPPPPTAVVILPANATVFSHTPATLTVEGGVPPYTIFSSNSAILPVAQAATAGTVVLLPAEVLADTAVQITAQDSIGQTATATITVKPAPIFNTLVVTPNAATCGANAVCSGQTATASVTVTGPGGAGIANRQVKFDVVSGAFSIESTDPAHPLVQSLTVVSDVNGVAQVILQAAAGVPTQPALIRATELTTGEQQTAQFTIVQTINGSAVLSVIPSTVTFTGPDTLTCTNNFRADFFIFGGKPPYQVAVSPNFPIVVFLTNVPVTVEGGSFSAITNGNCTDANGVTLIITDAQGLTTTAKLINQLGTTAPPPPPPPATPTVSIQPKSYTVVQTAGICPGPFPFVVQDGKPQYNVVVLPPLGQPIPTVTPNPVLTSPGNVTVGNVTNPGPADLTYTVRVGDSSSPQTFDNATIKCKFAP